MAVSLVIILLSWEQISCGPFGTKIFSYMLKYS